MSASTVIADVTDTMQELLKSEQAPQGVFDISLRSPAEETIDQFMKPRVNLFLLRVQENPFAKNADFSPIGFGELKYPSLALNLLYLLTTFAVDKLDEYRVMGEAMRVFYDNATITAPLLKGSLENTSEELHIDLCPFTLDDLTKIWNAFNKPLRVSVCYEVRMVLIDSSIRKSITRVVEKSDHFQVR
jgi:hypothetical protein